MLPNCCRSFRCLKHCSFQKATHQNKCLDSSIKSRRFPFMAHCHNLSVNSAKNFEKYPGPWSLHGKIWVKLPISTDYTRKKTEKGDTNGMSIADDTISLKTWKPMSKITFRSLDPGGLGPKRRNPSGRTQVSRFVWRTFPRVLRHSARNSLEFQMDCGTHRIYLQQWWQ
jgi:hypothetical protein